MEGLVGPEALARLASPTQRRLQVADLDVGVFGVLEVVVDQVHPPRVFQRKRGGEGMLCRVTLSDTTGTIDLVLWDDEIRLTQGPVLPGARVILRGATVKAGYRGGLELGLGSAVVDGQPASAGLRGTLVRLEPTKIVGSSFRAEAVLATDDGEATVVAWDDAVKLLQVALGSQVELPDAVPHPALPGWWIAGRAPG